MVKGKIKFIDLFAGIGGTRIGFEEACKYLGFEAECIFTSEIKEYAIETYKDNFGKADIQGDIQKIKSSEIPDFDYLLGGFPCQPFSSAGNRMGFFDTRGTLFFDIERILKEKKPKGFLLENVEGLANHDGGNTLNVILKNLKNLGYKISYSIIDSSKHGVPQQRKRTYIVGRRDKKINLDNLEESTINLKQILERNKKTLESPFIKKLLKKYKPSELYGKSIKDKRGGKDNIHSWDINLKGSVNAKQKILLSQLLKERRRKCWAEIKGIKWMDGMPLTIEEIKTFISNDFLTYDELKKELDDLVNKKYLRFEYPKKQTKRKVNNGIVYDRVFDESKEQGYNIVAGKLSFEINKILDPDGVAPTIVATDANKLGVIDCGGIRQLTIREGLRLFGFPGWYKINQTHSCAFDLLGNTVVIPVIKKVSERLIK